MRRLRRHPVLAAGLTLLAVVMLLSRLGGERLIVINTSPSVPPGLYIRSSAESAVGELIDFRIPLNARPYVLERIGETGENWYILKPIAAGPEDRIDTTGSFLRINGERIAPIATRDAAGRDLPVWRADRVLREDEFFVFSDRIPNSFDSRCYGPIHRKQIDAVRRPLITW